MLKKKIKYGVNLSMQICWNMRQLLARDNRGPSVQKFSNKIFETNGRHKFQIFLPFLKATVIVN